MAKTPPNLTPDQRAVIDAANRYIETFSQAVETGKTAPAYAATTPDCPCRGGIDQAKDGWSNGKTVEAKNYLTVMSFGVPKVATSRQNAKLNIAVRIAAQKTLDRRGKEVSHDPPRGAFVSALSFEKTSEGWLVSSQNDPTN